MLAGLSASREISEELPKIADEPIILSQMTCWPK